MVDNPSVFKWVPSNKIGKNNTNPYKGKVIILADESTQSQGEYSVMALQTIPHSITIGRKTTGVDGVKTIIPMGGDLTLSYSGYGIYYPDKSQTQLIGVRTNANWGEKTVDELAKFIQENHPDLKGFNRRLYSMKQFYETYIGNEIVSPSRA